MRAEEFIWAASTFGLLWLFFQIFRRFRRGQFEYIEIATFKTRLSQPIKALELRIRVTLMAFFIGLTFFTFLAVHHVAKPGHPIEGLATLYAGWGASFVGIPLAFLAANGISWLLPGVRAENLRAMAGSQVSFGRINRDLALFGALLAALGVAMMTLAILEPWAR